MRYLPLTQADRAEMRAAVGVSDIDALYGDVPDAARFGDFSDLPRHMTEMQVERSLGALAGQNVAAGSVPFFVGAGAYKHHIPASVDHLIQRSEFLTSYTPYQPEISQGTLQVLFEFQTQVAMITGMEVANASMYDGSTACGEAVLMAHRLTKRGKTVVSGGVHPHYTQVIETLLRFSDNEMVAKPPSRGGLDLTPDDLDEDTACIVIQMPDVFGAAFDYSALAQAAHDKGVLVVAVFTEVVSLGALKPPGEMGADIVAGEAQGLGVGLNFGGPYLGLFATYKKYVRQMPGRVCGETVDANGERGYVLTLSTREQHIRREKATSNICTNSGLCALAWTIHMTLLGDRGFRQLADLNHALASNLADSLSALDGVDLLTPIFFNEFTLRLPVEAAYAVDVLAKCDVLAGVPAARLFPRAGLENELIVAVTETCSQEDCDVFVEALKEAIAC